MTQPTLTAPAAPDAAAPDFDLARDAWIPVGAEFYSLRAMVERADTLPVPDSGSAEIDYALVRLLGGALLSGLKACAPTRPQREALLMGLLRGDDWSRSALREATLAWISAGRWNLFGDDPVFQAPLRDGPELRNWRQSAAQLVFESSETANTTVSRRQDLRLPLDLPRAAQRLLAYQIAAPGGLMRTLVTSGTEGLALNRAQLWPREANLLRSLIPVVLAAESPEGDTFALRPFDVLSAEQRARVVTDAGLIEALAALRDSAPPRGALDALSWSARAVRLIPVQTAQGWGVAEIWREQGRSFSAFVDGGHSQGLGQVDPHHLMYRAADKEDKSRVVLASVRPPSAMPRADQLAQMVLNGKGALEQTLRDLERAGLGRWQRVLTLLVVNQSKVVYFTAAEVPGLYNPEILGAARVSRELLQALGKLASERRFAAMTARSITRLEGALDQALVRLESELAALPLPEQDFSDPEAALQALMAADAARDDLAHEALRRWGSAALRAVSRELDRMWADLPVKDQLLLTQRRVGIDRQVLRSLGFALPPRAASTPTPDPGAPRSETPEEAA